jgi:hypothetical protein
MDRADHVIQPQDIMVLTEEEALELIAMLLSSGRGLLDEPIDYGPMRLVTAAQKLIRMILPRTTPETRPFLTTLDGGIRTHLPRRRADPESWHQFIDEANRWMARELMRRAGLDLNKK